MISLTNPYFLSMMNFLTIHRHPSPYLSIIVKIQFCQLQCNLLNIKIKFQRLSVKFVKFFHLYLKFDFLKIVNYH